jgi:phosphohistidine phosphatase
VASVNFYLVRHGDALSAAENPQRPLSSEGRRRVQQTAERALERGIWVSAIYHSGILRAKETAEILAERMSVAGVAELSGLLPEDDPALVKAELDAAHDSILLVGHLPFMSRLAGLLIHGDPERPGVEFSPAALGCFTRSAAQWKLAWHIAP